MCPLSVQQGHMARFRPFRVFIVRDQILIPASLNFALNSGLAWLTFRNASQVPIWGDPSVAGDFVVTLFLLPFLTCLLIVPGLRRQVRAGAVGGLEHEQLRWGPVFSRLPSRLFLRSLVVGALSVLLGAPFTLAALWGSNLVALSMPTFVLSKGIYAGGMAAVVTPLIALSVLAENSAESQSALPAAR